MRTRDLKFFKPEILPNAHEFFLTSIVFLSISLNSSFTSLLKLHQMVAMCCPYPHIGKPTVQEIDNHAYLQTSTISFKKSIIRRLFPRHAQPVKSDELIFNHYYGIIGILRKKKL